MLPANNGGSACAVPSRPTTLPAKSSGDNERFYRMGFEAALHAKNRCMEFDQVSAEMDAALEDAKRQHPGAKVEEPFIRGYQRGREHYQQMCDENKAA